jgi:hypothetical protein
MTCKKLGLWLGLGILEASKICKKLYQSIKSRMFTLQKKWHQKRVTLFFGGFGLTFPWNLLSGLVIGDEMIGIWRE